MKHNEQVPLALSADGDGVIASPSWSVDASAVIDLLPSGASCIARAKGVGGTATVTALAANSAGAPLSDTQVIVVDAPPSPAASLLTIQVGPAEPIPVVPPPPPSPPPSPPLLDDMLLTPERTAAIQKLWTDQHPWAVFCPSMADYAGGAYGDGGQWDLLLWIMTGDPERAAKAFAKSDFTPNADRNGTREGGWWSPLVYHWLRGTLTAEQQADRESKLKIVAEQVLGLRPETGHSGTRLGDSDELVGHYFCLALTDRVLGTNYLSQAIGWKEGILGFCIKAEGGEWIESGEYNLGTVQLLLWGAYLDGIEKWPEVAALVPQFLEQQRWNLTPDLKDSVQWGDEEKPHDLTIYYRAGLLAALVGFGGDPTGEGRALLMRLIEGLQPYSYYFGLHRMLLVFDPTVPANPHVNPSGFRWSAGVGLGIHYGPNYHAQIHAATRVDVDHQVPYCADVRVYDDGEFIVWHPLGYVLSASGNNVALLGGLGPMVERGPIEANESRIVYRTRGPYTYPGHWDPPPAFLNDYTRTIEFAAPAKVIVTDAFDGVVPTRIDRYHEADRVSIHARLALWQVIWHMPTEPREVSPGVWEWTTPGGKAMRLTATGHESAVILKTARDVNIIGYIHDSQLTGWQVRLKNDSPTATIQSVVERI